MLESEQVLRQFLDLSNRHNVAAISELIADDVAFANPMTGPTGKEGMVGFHAGLFSGFPDVSYRVDRMISSGGTAIAECTVEGTHRGEIASIPATNRRTTTAAAFVVDVADGKVSRWTSYFDVAGMLRQLGVGQ